MRAAAPAVGFRDASNGTKLPYTRVVTGNEFLCRLKRLGRIRGIEVRIDQRHDKGSHSTLFYGNRKTTLKDPRKGIGLGLLHRMLVELGLTRSDIEE
jgi:mRNA interferase HicA